MKDISFTLKILIYPYASKSLVPCTPSVQIRHAGGQAARKV